ncbi:unnamed protein product [Rotaria sp. Silwood1]|nr:unnamed protein product [Rotaria sp. Silwood1]
MNAVAISSAASNTIQPRRHIVQNYMLIWVDANINEANEDCQNTLTQLRNVVNEINLCTTLAQCIGILNDMDDEKAFVICSGALGQHLVPEIHRMAQVHAIYVFCGNKALHEQWAKEWPKVEGVFISKCHS